jgi:hypothetical protein
MYLVKSKNIHHISTVVSDETHLLLYCQRDFLDFQVETFIDSICWRNRLKEMSEATTNKYFKANMRTYTTYSRITLRHYIYTIKVLN